jgi:hypothetical protein
MKQTYTMYIYKADKRKKTGERLVSTTVWKDRDDNGMRREVAELFDTYNPDDGYRFEWFPTMSTVKNLMSGQPVEILTEHVGSFMDPSQERYWSM